MVIGAVAVWMMSRRAAGPSHSVKALREESEKFRDEVNDHFVETAELINQLTDSYKKVFDHLSDGAERLVDDKVIRERMPEVSDQEIRLKRIGQTSTRRTVQDSDDGSSAQSAAKSESDAVEESATDSEKASEKDSLEPTGPDSLADTTPQEKAEDASPATDDQVGGDDSVDNSKSPTQAPGN